MSLDIRDGSLANYSTQGFLDDDSLGLVKFDFDKEIEVFSSKINDFEFVEYEQLRKKQIAKAQQEKFGKHDFQWALSRLNYHGIGAKLMTYRMKKKMNKAYISFEV